MCVCKNSTDSELFNFNDLNLEICKEVQILGIIINKNLTFKSQIKYIWRSAHSKLSTLLRIS